MKKISILITILLLINGCGFKIVNKNNAITFYISDVNTAGEKRINYKLRNKLLSFNKIGENPIILDLVTSKTKIIKEKNIKNEITKYSVIINTVITIRDSTNNEIEKFKFEKNGEYNVSKQHSQTLSNEKKLINLLTEELKKEIIDELIIRLDDL